MDNVTNRKRSFSQFSETSLIDAVQNTLLHPRKRRKTSTSNSQSQSNKNDKNNNMKCNEMRFNFEQHLNSVESHTAQQILQEMIDLESWTVSNIDHFQNRIKDEIHSIEEQKQS